MSVFSVSSYHLGSSCSQAAAGSTLGCEGGGAAKIPASNQSIANDSMAFKSQALYYSSHPNNEGENVPHHVGEDHSGCKLSRMAFCMTSCAQKYP